MKIGDEVFVHGYVDEIRDGHVIIRNDGGYFGTVRSEIRPNDEDVGKPCWKIYVIAERRRFPKTYYDYFCDVPHVVEYWKKFILNGGDATLYARERPFTKSDRAKLGKTVFWTKKEAEDAIGVVYTADTPQTERIKTPDYCDICNHKGCGTCIANNLDDYCVPSNYEPTTQTETQNSNLTFEKADTPQTDCGWKEDR